MIARRLVERLEAMQPEALLLQRADEALDDGVALCGSRTNEWLCVGRGDTNGPPLRADALPGLDRKRRPVVLSINRPWPSSDDNA
jgi:hypothetical protein